MKKVIGALFGVTAMLICCTGDQLLNPVIIETVPSLDLHAPIFRPHWHHASRPAVIDTSISERGHIAWYNPYDPVSIDEIWNNRDIGSGESGVAPVLEIVFKPVDHKFIRDTVNNVIDSTSVEIERENSWAGFMRCFADTLEHTQGQFPDLNKAQYLEIRLKGDVGIMHIDLGLINEDVDGDGWLDNEDIDGLRILDEEEDVGLDGLPDSLEFGYDPQNGVFDPAGDNYEYSDPYNFNIWRINGTEGNHDDPDGGWYPDTEDQDLDGLERTDAYFSYRINLADTINFYNGFQIDGTRNEYGWRTIHIPLNDPLALDQAVGSPSWEQFEYMRIWFDSLSASAPTDSIIVQLAAMSFGSTGWDDATYVADSLRGPIHFDIGFISQEVSSDFIPPPGVPGYYDQVRDVVSPTRALLIMFEDLNAEVLINTPDSGLMLIADTGKAERSLDRAINLTAYENLEAFVYGDIDEEDSILFFFRMGADEDVYFEYRTILKTGWDPENYVFFDLVEVEVMKDQFLRDRRSGIDSSLTRQSGKYLVKVTENNHAPNITLVKYFAVGVINLDPDDTAEGDVWIYGLRQTGHRAFE